MRKKVLSIMSYDFENRSVEVGIEVGIGVIDVRTYLR